ncbi:hypothetical protein R1sor_002977 [Riccia sorocarpa]|uniref:DUF4042 domain-containing protein n=1 Tax=Riccia sorocarpa TaxID=122646 RepID=A0ABD3H3Q2_9MARC
MGSGEYHRESWPERDSKRRAQTPAVVTGREKFKLSPPISPTEGSKVGMLGRAAVPIFCVSDLAIMSFIPRDPFRRWLLETMNAQQQGPSPRVEGDPSSAPKHHYPATHSCENLKTIVQITHEHGGQMAAEEANALLRQLLPLIRFPDLSGTSYSKGMSGRWTEGASSRSIDSRTKVTEDDMEAQKLVLTAVGNLFSRSGNNVQKETWIAVVKMLRFMLEAIVSGKVIEDSVASRFYAAVLRCAHLVLSDNKGSVEEHIPSLVGGLRAFFTYGLSSTSSLVNKGGQVTAAVRKPGSWQEPSSTSQERGAYRPPHLRGKAQASRSSGSRTGGNEGYIGDYDGQGWGGGFSSDSEQSDSDAHLDDADRFKSSKVRTNAILSIQAIARADPKILHAHWMTLLPTQDVFQPRPYQATLLTVLLNDPVMKARMAAASTLACMLEGPARAFLQVAEHREIARSKSFTTLSSSLGQLVIQLHIGLLHVISNEPPGVLVVSALKALSLLVSASPYSRLPQEMLPWTICTVHRRLREFFYLSIDQGSMMLSVASVLLWAVLLLLPMLLQCSTFRNPKALKNTIHTYPAVVASYWEQISSSIAATIQLASSCSTGSGEAGHQYFRQLQMSSANGQTARLAEDKVVHSAIKLLDESLRAVSGYKGTDESLDDGLYQNPSPFLIQKAVRLVSQHLQDGIQSETDSRAGVKLWMEAVDKHLPLTLSHSAPMVRGAALTCFAGLTSAVFCSLPADKQNYVLSTLTYAAWNDDTPAVRSAACRAIGVVVGFPQIAESDQELERAVKVVLASTNDSSVSVRITASWALANICDALRSTAERKDDLGPIYLCLGHLADCALKAAKDCDKVRANAVRALGNLARFANFSDQTAHVQWNVCHALGNLFLNKTINLSRTTCILLLLLRDSSNYKIRIHAASALAVPASREDYGESFTDVVKGLIHALETIDSEHDSAPTGFKYIRALTEQLTTTVVHVLGLSKPDDFLYLREVLSKRSAFILDFFTVLCASVGSSGLRDAYDDTGVLERMAEVNISQMAAACSSKGHSAYDDKPLPPPKEKRRYGLQLDEAAGSSGGIGQRVEDLQKAVRAVADMYRYGDNTPTALSWDSLFLQVSASIFC